MKKRRIRKAVRVLKEEKVDALLITDMVNIRYVSGFTGSEASVIMTPEAFFVLVDSRYTTQARREAPLFHISRISKRTEDTAKLISRLKVKKVGFDSKSITYADYKELEERLAKTSLVPVRESLLKLRMRKEGDEINIIREGIGIAAYGFNQIKDQIQAGKAERDVAVALEFVLRKAGAEKMSFDTIVASGKRSALPHGVASSKKIRTGELVTIDFGIQYKGYRERGSRPSYRQNKARRLFKKSGQGCSRVYREKRTRKILWARNRSWRGTLRARRATPIPFNK